MAREVVYCDMVIPALLNNISIVLVEDHAEFRSMLGRFLMLEGACQLLEANCPPPLNA
jgi:hypothetical protein